MTIPVAHPPRHPRRRSRGKAVLLLVLISAGGFALAVFDGKLFFRALSLGGTVLLVLSVAAMIVTSRRAKRVCPRAVLASAAVSVGSLALYLLFVGFNLTARFVPAALLAGLFVGAGWAMASRLAAENGTVRSIGGGWHLAVWGLFFAGSQAVSLFTGRPPAVAAVLLLAGTGLVVGHGLTLLTRSRALQAATEGKT